MEKKCLECASTFNVQKSRQKSKYCSNICRIKAQSSDKNIQRKRKIIKCLCCNNLFEKLSYLKSKFCCKECYWKYRNENPEIKFQSNQTDNRIEKKCVNCDKSYKVHKYRKNNKYCSISCYNDYRRISIICPTCNSDFIITNYQNRNVRYCSIKCSSKGILKRKSKFSQSIITFIEKYYRCEEEKYIKDETHKYFIDICLLDYNILIECNGDYWHCNPIIYDYNYYNKKIRKTASEIWDKDGDKLHVLKELGYKVIVVWEYDWNNEEDFFNNLKIKIENEIYKN
jgi:G:T-mismatch repair DNA endonuclease (very short patch repair protein)